MLIDSCKTEIEKEGKKEGGEEGRIYEMLHRESLL